MFPQPETAFSSATTIIQYNEKKCYERKIGHNIFFNLSLVYDNYKILMKTFY